ncbi:MAG: helix-turn-helix domain-containing protein [Candidatus Micrarchaeia archaeon]|jgi:sugar-specific transcriptional regulator TrmB
MKEIKRILDEMGFTQNEIKVYIALLELGLTTTGPIVKKCNLHIPRVYDALERLIQRGMVSYILKNNKKHFEAADPKRIIDILVENEKKMNEIIPKLRALKNPKKKEEITVYQGTRGIRTVCDFVLSNLNNGEEYLDFGVSGKFKEVMGPYWNIWQKTKKEKNINSRCIFEEKIRKNELIKEYFGQAKFVPSKYHCSSDTMIFKDYVIIFIWDATPPSAVVIQDKNTSVGYTNLFNWMWTHAKK